MHAWRLNRVREMKSCTRGNSNHPPPTCEGTPFPFNATTLQETCLERMEHSSGQFGFGFEHAFASEQTVGLRAAHEVSSGPLPCLIWCGCWRSCIVSPMFARLFFEGSSSNVFDCPAFLRVRWVLRVHIGVDSWLPWRWPCQAF